MCRSAGTVPATLGVGGMQYMLMELGRGFNSVVDAISGRFGFIHYYAKDHLLNALDETCVQVVTKIFLGAVLV